MTSLYKPQGKEMGSLNFWPNVVEGGVQSSFSPGEKSHDAAGAGGLKPSR